MPEAHNFRERKGGSRREGTRFLSCVSLTFHPVSSFTPHHNIAKKKKKKKVLSFYYYFEGKAVLGFRTQGLMLTGQARYHLNHSPSPFLGWIFSR
jgi:hypothetical protein